MEADKNVIVSQFVFVKRDENKPIWYWRQITSTYYFPDHEAWHSKE